MFKFKSKSKRQREIIERELAQINAGVERAKKLRSIPGAENAAYNIISDYRSKEMELKHILHEFNRQGL